MPKKIDPQVKIARLTSSIEKTRNLYEKSRIISQKALSKWDRYRHRGFEKISKIEDTTKKLEEKMDKASKKAQSYAVKLDSKKEKLEKLKELVK